MQHRMLGATGFAVSQLALGAGPVAELLTGSNEAAQRAVLAEALRLGVNWIDTAATYGDGASERQLGQALHALDALDHVHIATKVRLLPDQLSDVGSAIRASVAESLRRLGTPRVSLLQLHNAVTSERGAIPTSVTPEDVLRAGGIADRLEELRQAGLVRWLGWTGIGDPASLQAIAAANRFDTLQIPYSLANPTAAHAPPSSYRELNHGQVLETSARQQVGVFAIRVLAGGALAGQPPSAYTHKTKFFPLELYRRDELRARRLAELLPAGMSIREAALRFPLNHPGVSSVIVGLATVEQARETAELVARGPLPVDLYQRLLAACWE